MVIRITACSRMYRYSKSFFLALRSVRLLIWLFFIFFFFLYVFDFYHQIISEKCTEAGELADRHISFISHIWCGNPHTICFPELEFHKKIVKGLQLHVSLYYATLTLATNSISVCKHWERERKRGGGGLEREKERGRKKYARCKRNAKKIWEYLL